MSSRLIQDRSGWGPLLLILSTARFKVAGEGVSPGSWQRPPNPLRGKAEHFGEAKVGLPYAELIRHSVRQS